MATDSQPEKLHALKAWIAEHSALGIVLGISLALRLGLFIFYAPVSYSDSKTYVRLAGQIVEGWINYDGSRTPGYPAFLAILKTDQNVWLVQMGMGLLITLCMYFLGWQLGASLERRKRMQLALLAALAHTLNLGQLFFESSLLSETLATFLIILVITGWVVGYRYPRLRTVWLAGGMGLLSGLAALTRGYFILLPFWTLVWIWLFWAEKSVSSGPDLSVSQPGKAYLSGLWDRLINGLRKTFPALIAYVIPFSVVVGLWIGFIRFYYNQWGLETISGYRMVQNTGTFFELVPDEYAAVRDTYIRYRDAKVDESGSQTNAIWGAIPELMEVSGLGFYDLSRLMGKISIELIRNHPGLFMQNVLKGWWLFWRAPVYWSADYFSLKGLIPAINAAIFIERILLLGSNIFFLLTSMAALVPAFRRTLHFSPILRYLCGLIWSISILQAFLDHGDNPRFLIPLQSLVVLWCLWFGFRLFQRLTKHPTPGKI